MEKPFQEDEISELPQIDQNDEFRGSLQDLDRIVKEIDISNIIQQEEDDDAEEESISKDDEEKLLSDDIDSDEFVEED